MSTRALVPNASGEGSLGTVEKAWGAMYVNTPKTGANDQSVPSTAWVQALVAQAVADAQKQAKLDAHPVGSYYFSDDSTSPATLFGGTWEALPAGYTLIAQGSGTDDFGSFTYTAGQKYGERKHQLTTDEMPTDYVLNLKSVTEDGGNPNASCNSDSSYHGRVIVGGELNQRGGGKPYENMPLSMAAYAWRRTA